MFNSILVLCTGNICRSPIAERILRDFFPEKEIDSAGLGALVGKPADASAINVAEKKGISLQGHKGRQFTAEMGRRYQLILVMERMHLEQVSNIAPELRGKTMLLGHWNGNKDIPDPYKKSDEAFDSVYKLIEQSCKCWISKIAS
ncbi:protein tyrosine phosphatase [Klebsiella pneumoniae]|uniref:arsenate reductase/protein-tyrosine-phosphatase family protein n=1 Tax=Klebsiella pneumoniae TaxID=573 RepID=UPI00157F912C|nr:protein tyrosine phosphatase [Klebsiella pneumoniae]MDE1115040.1 protein tyrosine phosphatase [Klebsiella pneumoniae]MDZ0800701.1 protein tyrosine phosphatase [Klebsiella pneumoniae]QPM50620.1 protein tyrosine phosphatase [Klebsiella pneumoniae]QPM55898.1 protein tyrosine phosphatase [Klebsiella pneumoniae]